MDTVKLVSTKRKPKVCYMFIDLLHKSYLKTPMISTVSIISTTIKQITPY